MIQNRPNMYDYEAYQMLPPEDRWIYNKLAIAEKQGLVCGPVGIPPPEGDYCVRPVLNMTGGGNPGVFRHGVGASGVNNELVAGHPGGYFWCEWLDGPHLWVDYQDDVPVYAKSGTPDADDNYPALIDVSDRPELPEWLKGIARFLYVEYKGGKIIEVHARWQWSGTEMHKVYNPDGSFYWDYGNSIARNL